MHTQAITLNNGRTFLNRTVPLPRVLVVDDDCETTELLKIILEPNACEVMTANSGPEAIELARKNALDVMVVDLLMPGMDGLQVCAEVRRFSNVPILVLSAVGKPNMATQALDMGADDYLAKPMSTSVLVASIKRLARRARAEQEAHRLQNLYPNA